MPSSDHNEVRDYAFADKALALRKRAGLTQQELGALLGLSVKTIGGWETGLFSPNAARLQQLIALYLGRGMLQAGREAEEATALWEAARGSASRRLPPFDLHWFASLHGDGSATVPGTRLRVSPPSPVPAAGRVERHDGREAPAAVALRHDWGEAPAAAALRGRTEELALLEGWVRDEGCRVVEVVGAGGIGKTALAARLVQAVAPEFPVLYWRSLRNAPPIEDWLAGAIAALSAAQALPPEDVEARLTLMLALLREQRALLVLDNLETVLESGAATVRYRAGYEGYGEALRRLSESEHRGCLLLTSREQPLRADDVAVHILRLGGLGAADGQALLASRHLAGDEAAWGALVARYAGNPLALKVVGETIQTVFGGDVAALVSEEAAVFGGIRELLDEQVGRLSALERAVGLWLAVEREPVGFAELAADLGPGVTRAHLVEAVEGLRRRSLVEAGGRGAFTLQPVVLEYATAQLVERVRREVLAGEPALLVSHALVKAQSKDYVRRSQERLIALPLLEQLRTSSDNTAVERRLLALLDRWRGRGKEEQGYGPGNVVNLLRLLRGDLRGLDLSRLSIRQAYLADIPLHDTTLAGAHLPETVLSEVFSFIASMALSADGAWLAVGTSAGTISLWHVPDRRVQAVWQGHTSCVLCVVLSGTGALLASCSFDGTARVWDTASGRAVAILEGHTGGGRTVALSRDGQVLASTDHAGTLRLWETSSGRLLASLQAHTGGAAMVALSGDGALVATGGLDGLVRLWDTTPASGSPGRLCVTLEEHTGGVVSLALSDDGGTVASARFDGSLRLWDTASGALLATLHEQQGWFRAVALSRDGGLLASASADGLVRLWAARSEQLLASLQGHTGLVFGVAMSGDGALLASMSLDGTVRLWERHTRQPVVTLRGYMSGIRGVALSADGGLLASAVYDGTVHLWDSASGRLLATLQGHSGGVMSVALRADGRLAASASIDGTVRLWDTAQRQPLSVLGGHSGSLFQVALSADGSRAAAGGEDGTVHLWNTVSGQPLATLQGHTGAVWGVALSGDGRLLASSGDDGTVRLWDAASGRAVAILEGHNTVVNGVALSEDGQLMATGGQDETVRLWDTASGRALAVLRGHTAGVRHLAFGAGTTFLASPSEDGTVRLWDPASGLLLQTLHGHTGMVWSAALSGDGRLLASGGEDGTVRLWDTATGATRHILRPDRLYERLDITGLTGVTDAQQTALLVLGAVEHNFQATIPYHGG